MFGQTCRPGNCWQCKVCIVVNIGSDSLHDLFLSRAFALYDLRGSLAEAVHFHKHEPERQINVCKISKNVLTNVSVKKKHLGAYFALMSDNICMFYLAWGNSA